MRRIHGDDVGQLVQIDIGGGDVDDRGRTRGDRHRRILHHGRIVAGRGGDGDLGGYDIVSATFSFHTFDPAPGPMSLPMQPAGIKITATVTPFDVWDDPENHGGNTLWTESDSAGGGLLDGANDPGDVADITPLVVALMFLSNGVLSHDAFVALLYAAIVMLSFLHVAPFRMRKMIGLWYPIITAYVLILTVVYAWILLG